MTNKHAYLIMAHNQVELLAQLLKALDYKDNDIYVHLDRKMPAFDEQVLRSQIKRSYLHILPKRMDVRWGQYSQIECELYLLSEAVRTKHEYYHLLSGVDFPLKNQREIHAFFAKKKGTEFVHFDTLHISEQVKQRVSKYHLICKPQSRKSFAEKLLDKLLLTAQFSVDRIRHTGIQVQKGANWFSITDDLARYVVSEKKFISRYFKWSICADEMFLQTLVINSPFRDKISSGNFCGNSECIMRYIDWQRGNPYEFTSEDYTLLLNSEMLFARKFNWNKDRDIVQRLLNVVVDKE